MTVRLAPEWGGATVAGLVADALAVSQAAAVRRGAHQIDLGDLAVALLSAADDALGRVLEALPVDRQRLASYLSGQAEARVTAGLPEAGPDVLAVIALASQWGGDSDDEAVGLRLLGEVARTLTDRVRPLRDAGIDVDRLRWAAARCGLSYEAPVPPAEPLRAPATPTLDELRVRRPGRRSAAASSLLRQVMPNNGSTGTPYGLMRAPRWGMAHIIVLCLRPLIILAMIAFGIRSQSWWSVSAVLVSMSPEVVPLILSIVSYAGLAVIAGLKFPWPFIVLVLVCAAADGTSFWYQWWMKRVDEGDPSLPVSAIRRAALRHADHLVAAWRLERANGR